MFGVEAEYRGEPCQVGKAMDVSPEFDIQEWWKCNADALPHWSSAAKKVLVVQTSSASAERAFSILNNSFGDEILGGLCRSLSHDLVQPALNVI